MRTRLLSCITLFLATVSVAHAEDIDFWNFRDTLPRETRVNNLTKAEVLKEGMHIQTNTDGFLVWDSLSRPAEVVTIRARALRTSNAFFLWQPLNGEQGMYQLPFAIPAGEFSQEIDIILSNYPKWDWRTPAIGMGFTPGTDVIIEDITFRHWTPMEKLIEGWKSFWTFDTFRAYSINFLWGPLIATNEPARLQLFENLPPFAWSAMRIFYWLIAVAAIIALIVRFTTRNKTLAVGIVAATFCASWLILDLRMGLEILSYARDDIRTYVTQEGGNQTLRSHGKLYGVLHTMLPVIQKYERFALLTPGGSLAYPNLRYMAYPSIPVLDGQDMSNVKLWVIFERNDVRIDEQGRLSRPGDPAKFPGGREILTPPGKIVLSFDDNTYLFTVNP